MKKLVVMTIAAVVLLSACKSDGISSNVIIKTADDSVSYAFGSNMGAQLNSEILKSNKNINPEIVAAALLASASEKSQMTPEQAVNVIRTYLYVTLPAIKKQAGDEFLSKAKENKNATTTDSGVIYEITEEGDVTNKPLLADTIVANYKGLKSDGEKFDSSYDRGEPIEITLNNLIPAWQEVIPLLGKNGKVKIWAPANMAYGETGQHPLSGEVLYFEIDLIDIKK